MKKYDQVGGIIWVILGIGLCIESIKLKIGAFHKPGAGLAPFLIGVLLGILGFILMFSSDSKELGKDEEVKEEERLGRMDWKNSLIPFLVLLITFSYIPLLKLLGFLFTTFIFLFGLFKLSEPKRWLMPLILSASAAILSHLIFSVWLKCQFPKGILMF